MPRLPPATHRHPHQHNASSGDILDYHRLVLRGGQVRALPPATAPVPAGQRLMRSVVGMNNDGGISVRHFHSYRSNYAAMLEEVRNNLDSGLTPSLRGATQTVIERNTFPHKYQGRPVEQKAAAAAAASREAKFAAAAAGGAAGPTASCSRAAAAVETAASAVATATQSDDEDDDDDDEREKCTICLCSFVRDTDVR